MKAGLIIPNGIVGSPGGVLFYLQIRDFALNVESSGLDSFWVKECV